MTIYKAIGIWVMCYMLGAFLNSLHCVMEERVGIKPDIKKHKDSVRGIGIMAAMVILGIYLIQK